MACACGKNKSNQQTSAQNTPVPMDPVTQAAAQQSAENSIANSSRIRRG